MDEKDYLWLHLRDLPYFRAMLRSVEARIYQDYSLSPPVLDVGCGDGHFASIAFDRQIDVGLDPWTGPIREARRLGGYKTLIQADGGQMPFQDNSFASGMSNSVLEHIPHVQEVLAETARVLRKGSLFLFCVPNSRYLSELSVPQYLTGMRLQWAGEAYRDWFRRISRVFHAEPPEVWAVWLKEAGFELLEWFHYFSPQAMRVLEWGHYFGTPTLLAKALTGRWILAPKRWNLSLTERFVRPYVRSIHDELGVFTFYAARVILEN